MSELAPGRNNQIIETNQTSKNEGQPSQSSGDQGASSSEIEGQPSQSSAVQEAQSNVKPLSPNAELDAV